MEKILLFIISALVGGLGAWIIQNYGYRLGIVDAPNERSSHKKVTPKGGGIGILAVFVFCASVLEMPKCFWISCFFLSLVSLVGDRLEIKPKVRLIIQFGCAFVFLISVLIQSGQFLLFFLVAPLAVFIVGTANFYNFMDGINGIAGITGFVGFLMLAWYGHMTGTDSANVFLLLSVACACAGFLPFNIPRAKVFMGDVGSVLLGFVFACMVILLTGTFLDFIIMAGFLFPFYADELTTMVVRIHEGDKLTEAHRKHVYQLLANEFRFEHWKVSLGYGLAQLIVGLALIGLKSQGVTAVVLFLSVCLLWFSIVSAYIRMKLKAIVSSSLD